ncbi:MAG: matrixin family metalloprotease [Aggregatilineales bacterium]
MVRSLIVLLVFLLPALTTRAAAPLKYSLKYGQPAEDTLAAGQSIDYSFDGKAGDKPVIAMNARGGSMQPHISLFDPQGHLIGEDSNGGLKGNALLKGTVLAADGSYRVQATNNAQQGSGKFTLVINEEKHQVYYENDQPGAPGAEQHYQLTQPWNHTNITYSVANSLSQFSPQDVNQVIARAFQAWANVTPLTFTQVNGRGDINIKFAPIDGPLNILGETCPPGEACAGDVTFDNAENWTLGDPQAYSNISFLGVASHEFGHAIGLLHTTDATALMYPEYSPYDLQPNTDDIAGVQRLYGPGSGRVSNPTAAPGLPPAAGSPNGQMQVTGQLTDTQFAHFWDFDVEAGATATISMHRTAGDLDAFLILVDAQNHVLAYDDDSGGGNDAELRNIHFPAAGTFSVIATRYEQAQGFTTGSYSLSIQYGELPPATPMTHPSSAGSTTSGAVPTLIVSGNSGLPTAGAAGGVSVSGGQTTQFGQLPTLDSVLTSPFTMSATPVKQTRQGTVNRSQSYVWAVEWCATTTQTLAMDEASITPSFSINNQPVDSKLIAMANVTSNPLSCVAYFVVLSNWSPGNSSLVSTLTLKQPVYNGQLIFATGDYSYESDIQAS